MKRFCVVIKNYDDENAIEYVTKEPVSYEMAVAFDRQTEMIIEENQYTEIIEATVIR